MCLFPDSEGYWKISYLEFHCFSLSFILLKISRLETFFLSLCLFPVSMCAYHFCVLLFMLSIISPKISACQPGPIYLSFLMAVYIISFFIESHKFIPLSPLCFYFFFVCLFFRAWREICCISKVFLKTSCISEPKPAFAVLHFEGAHRKLLGTPS